MLCIRIFEEEGRTLFANLFGFCLNDARRRANNMESEERSCRNCKQHRRQNERYVDRFTDRDSTAR